MLKKLHIKNMILIRDVEIDFFDGFSVFTGETGAGKSILLDSLALVLGERANFSFIRTGSDFAEVRAIFSVATSHPSLELLSKNFISVEEDIIIRKIISSDGKSRSFINDVPVSVSFLRSIGSMLLDIHGQFDNQRLMNSALHRDIVDSFLVDKDSVVRVAESWNNYKVALQNFDIKTAEIKKLEQNKEYIEYSLAELIEINPKEDEEKYLLEKKIILSNAKKLFMQLSDIENYLLDKKILDSLNRVLRAIHNIRALLSEDKKLSDLEYLVEESYEKVSGSVDAFNDFRATLDFNEADLLIIEDRLSHLRSIAKKHKIQVVDLLQFKLSLEEQLRELKTNTFSLETIKLDLDIKYNLFKEQAFVLSSLRREAAKVIDYKIKNQLNHLKLQDAEFKTVITSDTEGAFGIDRLIFKVKTNRGSEFSDLNKIASGGEMARFMLALKIVLAEVDCIGTLILDEIDIGVGGDVAEAIGQRLNYLSEKVQTIVVTHSHQVAAKGSNHYKVIKEILENQVETKVIFLAKEDRINEVARMLSGVEITAAAREIAINLLDKK